MQIGQLLGLLRGEDILLSVSGIFVKPRLFQARTGYVLFPS